MKTGTLCILRTGRKESMRTHTSAAFNMDTKWKENITRWRLTDQIESSVNAQFAAVPMNKASSIVHTLWILNKEKTCHMPHLMWHCTRDISLTTETATSYRWSTNPSEDIHQKIVKERKRSHVCTALCYWSIYVLRGQNCIQCIQRWRRGPVRSFESCSV